MDRNDQQKMPSSSSSTSTTSASHHNNLSPSCHAHWDCCSGVSGYSMLASCLDATSKEEAQRQLIEIERLVQKGVPEKMKNKFSLEMRRTATAMRIFVVHKRPLPTANTPSSSPGAATTPTAAASTATTPFEELPQVNGLQVRSMLAKADATKIPPWVQEKSLEVLQEIAKAASNLFQTESVDPVHIDYGLDMVIEVVGTLLSLYCLKVKTVSCSPIPLGAGSVGLVPQPAPLTLQLLLGMPTFPGPPGLTGEFVTATGAALLRVLTCASQQSQVTKRPPTMTLRAVGFGTSEIQHVVRLSVGEVASEDNNAATTTTPTTPSKKNNNANNSSVLASTSTNNRPHNNDAASTPLNNTNSNQLPTRGPPIDLESTLWQVDTLTQIECNLDDMTPEHLSFAMNCLLEKGGAVDAWVTPIIMKKGRPAHTLHCLVKQQQNNNATTTATEDNNNHNTTKIKRLLETMFQQTTTLGIRVHPNISRVALTRYTLQVQTPYVQNNARKGRVDVKVGYLGGDVISVKPEFDHCQEIAMATGIPIHQVSEKALLAARSQHPALNNNSIGNTTMNTTNTTTKTEDPGDCHHMSV